ncbi:hypothetical protein Agub_g5590, partial [Astrephomene gubernaculifera]
MAWIGRCFGKREGKSWREATPQPAGTCLQAISPAYTEDGGFGLALYDQASFARSFSKATQAPIPTPRNNTHANYCSLKTSVSGAQGRAGWDLAIACSVRHDKDTTASLSPSGRDTVTHHIELVNVVATRPRQSLAVLWVTSPCNGEEDTSLPGHGSMYSRGAAVGCPIPSNLISSTAAAVTARMGIPLEECHRLLKDMVASDEGFLSALQQAGRAAQAGTWCTIRHRPLRTVGLRAAAPQLHQPQPAACQNVTLVQLSSCRLRLQDGSLAPGLILRLRLQQAVTATPPHHLPHPIGQASSSTGHPHPRQSGPSSPAHEILRTGSSKHPNHQHRSFLPPLAAGTTAATTGSQEGGGDRTHPRSASLSAACEGAVQGAAAAAEEADAEVVPDEVAAEAETARAVAAEALTACILVFLYDGRDGAPRGRMAYCNGRAREYLGMRPPLEQQQQQLQQQRSLQEQLFLGFDAPLAPVQQHQEISGTAAAEALLPAILQYEDPCLLQRLYDDAATEQGFCAVLKVPAFIDAAKLVDIPTAATAEAAVVAVSEATRRGLQQQRDGSSTAPPPPTSASASASLGAVGDVCGVGGGGDKNGCRVNLGRDSGQAGQGGREADAPSGFQELLRTISDIAERSEGEEDEEEDDNRGGGGGDTHRGNGRGNAGGVAGGGAEEEGEEEEMLLGTTDVRALARGAARGGGGSMRFMLRRSSAPYVLSLAPVATATTAAAASVGPASSYTHGHGPARQPNPNRCNQPNRDPSQPLKDYQLTQPCAAGVGASAAGRRHSIHNCSGEFAMTGLRMLSRAVLSIHGERLGLGAAHNSNSVSGRHAHLSTASTTASATPSGTYNRSVERQHARAAGSSGAVGSNGAVGGGGGSDCAGSSSNRGGDGGGGGSGAAGSRGDGAGGVQLDAWEQELLQRLERGFPRGCGAAAAAPPPRVPSGPQHHHLFARNDSTSVRRQLLQQQQSASAWNLGCQPGGQPLQPPVLLPLQKQQQEQGQQQKQQQQQQPRPFAKRGVRRVATLESGSLRRLVATAAAAG